MELVFASSINLRKGGKLTAKIRLHAIGRYRQREGRGRVESGKVLLAHCVVSGNRQVLTLIKIGKRLVFLGENQNSVFENETFFA